jgi:hypothetical protein
VVIIILSHKLEQQILVVEAGVEEQSLIIQIVMVVLMALTQVIHLVVV